MLAPAQRKAGVLLLGAMLISMLLETLGVGLVIPALALMADSNIATRYPALEPILAVLGHPTHVQLIGGGMIALAGVFAVKALFLALLSWQQSQFVFGVEVSLSQRLFAGYLRQPYAFHLQRNSAQLIHSVYSEARQLASALTAASLVITETLVVVGIAALLLLVEPLGTLLVMLTLGLASYMFHYFTKARVSRWGAARQLHETQRIQHLQQGLGSAKDIKLLGREDDFLTQYAVHNDGSALMGKRQAVLQSLPRLWLELLAVIGLAAVVISMLAQGKPLEALIPTLGLFAAAAFRLMPSVNRILGGVQSMRYAQPVINSLQAELSILEKTQPPSRTKPIPFTTDLQLFNVGYTYAGAAAAAITDINLTISRGHSVGFIGGSGAGKSTLIDVILGLLTPTRGHVRVDGTDIQSCVRGWQDQIGYVPQTIYLTDDTLRRNVAFGLAPDQIDEPAVQAAIQAAQLQEFVAGLPDGLNTVVGERGVRLSGGQRQRIGIARALYHDPPVLVLDEATSALDTATEQEVMQAVGALQGNKTLLIVAHRLSTVSKCDVLYRLEQGKLVDQGAFSKVINA